MALSVDDVEKLGPDPRLLRIFSRSKAFKKNQKKIRQCAARSTPQPRNQPAHLKGTQKLHVTKTIIKPEHIVHEIPSDTTSDTGRITCEKCKDLPEDEKCIRNYFVDRYHDPDALEGIVLTYALPGDRIRPKVLLFTGSLCDGADQFHFQKTGTQNQKKTAPTYKTPAELGLRPIEFRESVFYRPGGCGRDITILIQRKTGKMV
jgi:hypothetical protein